MNNLVTIKNISKKYLISSKQERAYAYSDILRSIFGLKKKENLRQSEYWALKNVTFSLSPGESLGIIGNNGSGKSTLLKIINNSISYDEGSININGKVNAMINLNSGLDRRMTGAQNIHHMINLLNPHEKNITALYNAIHSFSGLKDFINNPVSTYSSGMSARLGFSILTHTKPDLLLIDEILAVGDFLFKNKCFDHMHKLKISGTSFILVSHNITEISQFCDKALWLDNGITKSFGKVDDVIKDYKNFLSDKDVKRLSSNNISKKYGDLIDELNDIEDLYFKMYCQNETVDVIETHSPVSIKCMFNLKYPVHSLNLSFVIYSLSGDHITTITTLNDKGFNKAHNKKVTLEINIPDFNLNPNDYVVVLCVHEGRKYLFRNIVQEFKITSIDKLTYGRVSLNYTINERNDS